MKRYLKIYRIFLSQYLKRLVAYRMDFFIGALSFVFVQLSGILFIGLVFNQIPDLYGYSFYEMLFLYGFFQLPRGIDHLFTDNIWLIPMKIQRGDMDRYLVRPIPALFQLVAERFQQEAIGELVVGITVLWIASIQLHLSVTIISIIQLSYLVFCGTLIYTSLKLLTASLSFWITNSMQLMTSVYNLADFAKYPTPIFPKWIQILITYVVPFAFVSYFPASILLKQQAFLPIALGSTFALVLLSTAALSLWILGLKAYTSVGS